MEKILCLALEGFILFIFTAISIYYAVSKKPVCLYSGVYVHKEQITDIKKYNRAVALLWSSYTLVPLISFIIVFINTTVSILVCCVGMVVFLPVILKIYKKIYIRYSTDGKYHKPHCK